MKIIQFVCGFLGHFPVKHHRIQTPGNIIGPVKCRVCGHDGFVDEADRYIKTEWNRSA